MRIKFWNKDTSKWVFIETNQIFIHDIKKVKTNTQKIRGDKCTDLLITNDLAEEIMISLFYDAPKTG